jgi:hypothetical protein
LGVRGLAARVVGRRGLALVLARVPERELAQVEAERELAQVEAEPERGQVVAELELAQVEAEPGRGQVVAGLELAQVEAEPALGHLAVALRTKWVTALPHRGLPRPVVEDSAVAAETTRELAATEAAVAWEAAVTATLGAGMAVAAE